MILNVCPCSFFESLAVAAKTYIKIKSVYTSIFLLHGYNLQFITFIAWLNLSHILASVCISQQLYLTARRHPLIPKYFCYSSGAMCSIRYTTILQGHVSFNPNILDVLVSKTVSRFPQSYQPVPPAGFPRHFPVFFFFCYSLFCILYLAL